MASDGGAVAADEESIGSTVAAAAAEALAEGLPGAPCIDDVVKDAENRLRADPAFPGQRSRREALEDVDHDGRSEQLVSFRELCGARNCTWAIYATNRGCSKYVGTMEGAGWVVLETAHHELQDIRTSWVTGCAGAERYDAVLEYDGEEYSRKRLEFVNECSNASTAAEDQGMPRRP